MDIWVSHLWICMGIYFVCPFHQWMLELLLLFDIFPEQCCCEYGYDSLVTSQVALVTKHSPANAGDVRDSGLIPGSGRTPGGGHGNPLQYSYLDKAMKTGAWSAKVHRVAKSQTQLKKLSTHTHTTFCLSIPSVDTWVTSTFWYLS